MLLPFQTVKTKFVVMKSESFVFCELNFRHDDEEVWIDELDAALLIYIHDFIDGFLPPL